MNIYVFSNRISQCNNPFSTAIVHLFNRLFPFLRNNANHILLSISVDSLFLIAKKSERKHIPEILLDFEESIHKFFFVS